MKKLRIIAIAVVLLAAVGLTIEFAAQGQAKTTAPVTLTVEVFDRALPGLVADNCFQSKWIQEQVKKALNIDVKFVTVPRGQEVDKLKVLMAAGDAPDVCFTYTESVITGWAADGGLTELSSYITQYGANLVKYLGQDLVNYGRWSGKQWAVPAKRVLVGAFSAFVRQDWLDKISMKVPTTNQQFYDMLQAFKDKNPGNVTNIVPFGIQGVGTSIDNVDWTVHMLVRSFVTKETQEDRYALSNEGRWIEPGYKEGIRMLNTLYNKGLISPDFALDKDGKQYERDAIQGLMGSFIHNYDQAWRNPNWQVELAKNVPDGKWVPMDPFVNYAGQHAKMRYAQNGLFIVVPAYSKNAAAAIAYLNWMSDPAVLKVLQNGILGKQYTEENASGIPINKITNDKLPDDLKIQATDFPIISNGYEFGTEAKNIEAASLNYPGVQDLYKQALTIAMRDANPPPRFDVIIQNAAKYNGVLTQKGQEIFAKSITCKPSEFDSVYDSLVKDYLAAGGQAVIDEKRAAFKAMIAAGTIKAE